MTLKRTDNTCSIPNSNMDREMILKELKSMDNQDFLMILAIGKMQTNHLKVQKIAFIISKLLDTDIGSTPYKLGSFSETLMEKLQASQNSSFVNRDDRHYWLSEKGKIAYSLVSDLVKNKGREDVLVTLDTLYRMNDKDITAITYYLFPEFTSESEILVETQNRINELKKMVKSKKIDDKVVIEIDA